MNGTNSQSHSFGENFKTWIQTGGIILAAVWGVYTFVYKEITVPRSSPVNITLDLQLKKIEDGVSQQNLAVVEVKCSAKNPSSREIQLLPSVWIAYGSTVVAKTDNPDFTQEAMAKLKDTESVGPVFRYAKRDKISLIASGRLFPDTGLKPAETTTRTLVLYVPKGAFQQLDFIAVMPSAEDTGGIQLEWSLDEGDALVRDMYRVDKTGQRIAPQFDENGNYLDKRLRAQHATAYAAIPLGP